MSLGEELVSQIRVLAILVQRRVDGRIANGNGTTVAFNGLRYLSTGLDGSSRDNRREREPDSEGGRQRAPHGGQLVGLMALECWTLAG